MRNTISNSDDVIDSRDVIARISDLESNREDLVTAVNEAIDARDEARTALGTARLDPETAEDAMAELQDALDDTQTALEDAEKALAEWDDDYDGQELKTLRALEEEASGTPDWTYGKTLIRDSYFEDYARGMAEDIGAIQSDASWPNTCIDWEEAADQLKQDYFSVDFDGVEYWVRS